MAGFGYSGTTTSGGFGGYGSSSGGFGFGGSVPRQSTATYAPASPEEILARLKIMRAFAQIQATPKKSDHGWLGNVAGTISRIPGDFMRGAVDFAKGAPMLALGMAGNFAQDVGKQVWANPTNPNAWGTGVAKALFAGDSTTTIPSALAPGGSNVQMSSRGGIAQQMGKGIYQDFRHPLRNPFNTALNLFTLASLGAGGVARAGAFREALANPVDAGARSAGYYRTVQPFSFGDRAAAETQRTVSRLKPWERKTPDEGSPARTVDLGQEELLPPGLIKLPETTSETATDMWAYLDLKGKRAAEKVGEQTSLFGPRPDTKAIGGQLPPKGTPDTLQYGAVSDFMDSFTPSAATERALYKEATGGLQNPNRVLRDPNATPPPDVIGQGVMPETFAPAPYRVLPEDIQQYARSTGIVKPGDVSTHPAIAAIDKRIAAHDQSIAVRRQAIDNVRAVPRADQRGWSDYINAENRSTLTDANTNPTLSPEIRKWEKDIKRFETERRALVRQRQRLSSRVDVPDVPTGQQATGSPLKIGAAFDEIPARMVARRQAEERLNYEVVQAQMGGASLEQVKQVLRESSVGDKTNVKAAKKDIETAKQEYSKSPRGGAPGTVADRFDLETADLSSMELRRKAGEQIISNAEKNLAELKASTKPNPRIVRRDELRIERLKKYMAEHEDLPPSVLKAMDEGSKMAHPPALAQKIKPPTTTGARTNRSSRSGAAVRETPTAKVEAGGMLESRLPKPKQKPSAAAETKKSEFMQLHGRPEPAPPGTPRSEYLFEVVDEGGRRDVMVRATNQEWAEFQAGKRYKGHATLKGVYDEQGKVRELQAQQQAKPEEPKKFLGQPLTPEPVEPVNPRTPGEVKFSDEQAKAAFDRRQTETKLHEKIGVLEKKQDALYREQDKAKTPEQHEKIREQLDKVSEQRNALWDEIDALNGDLPPDKRIIDAPPAEQPPLTNTATVAADPAPAPIPRENAPATEPKPKTSAVKPPSVPKGKRVLIGNSEGETSAFAVLDEKTGKVAVVKEDGSDFGRHPKGSPEAQLWAKTQREGLAVQKHLKEQEAAAEIRGKIARDENVRADDFQEFVRDSEEGRATVEAYLGRDLTFRETPKKPRDLGTNERSINKAFASVGKETSEAKSLEKTITGQLADQISNEGVLTREQILTTLKKHVPEDVAQAMLKQMEAMVEGGRWGPKMGIAAGLPRRSRALEAFMAPKVPVRMNVRSIRIDPSSGEVVIKPATVEMPNNPITRATIQLFYGLGEKYAKVGYTEQGAQFLNNTKHAKAIRGMMNWRADHEAKEIARITALREAANQDTDFISTLRAIGVTTKDMRKDVFAAAINKIVGESRGIDRSKIIPSGRALDDAERGLFHPDVVNFPAPKVKEGVWTSEQPMGQMSVRDAKKRAQEAEDARRAARISKKEDGTNRSKATSIGYRAWDTTNDLFKLGILYTKPAYLSANVIGQILLVTADHGLNPFSLARSVALQRELFRDGRIGGSLNRKINEGFLSAWEEHQTRMQMGSGPMGAMLHGSTGNTGLRALNNKLNMQYQALLDTPWRDISFIKEARRWGFDDAEEIKDLLSNPAHADVRTSIFRRANRNIIDFNRLSSKEKQFWTRMIIFYPWIKGSTLWAGRWVSEHPAQALFALQGSKEVNQTRNKELGMVPSYLQGAWKTGERFQKGVGPVNKIFNPTAVSVLGSAGEVAQTLQGLIGTPKQAARLSEMLTPAASIGISAATGIDPFTQAPMDTSGFAGTIGAAVGAQFSGTISPLRMVHNVRTSAEYARGEGGVETKLVPYNEGEAISKWLGPGFSLFAPEVSKALRAVGVQGGGEVARDITASQPLNPSESRSRAAAELRSTQGKLAAKAQLYRDYVMQATDEAKRKNVAVPKDLVKNMNLYGQREINRVTWARELGKKESDMTAYERMMADIDLLMSRGILSKEQAKYLAVQMSGQPDSLIENMYGRWTHYYFGGARLSQIKKEMELKGVKVTY